MCNKSQGYYQSQGDYICPQCGMDKNGDFVHQKTHHTIPPYSEEEAKKLEVEIFGDKNKK